MTTTSQGLRDVTAIAFIYSRLNLGGCIFMAYLLTNLLVPSPSLSGPAVSVLPLSISRRLVSGE